MKIVSWNVNVRRDAEGQVAALATYMPDVVALQEVKAARIPIFREAFAAIGLPHVYETASACTAITDNLCRDRGVLTASRWPCALLPVPLDHTMPWPERLLSVCIDTPWGKVILNNVYVPPIGSSKGSREVKVLTLEQLHAHLASVSNIPRILCGDFNVPQEETPEGVVITFAQTRRPDGYSMPQAPWKLREHQTELNIMQDLAAYDLADVYRALHGYAGTDVSWLGQTTGYRLDHLFAAASLGAVSCRYLHELRDVQKLSDHSALEAVFAPTT